MNAIFPALDLHSFLERIASRIGFANTLKVDDLAEMRTFEGLTPRELELAAARHNLQVVRRMGGDELEFTHIAKI